MTGGVPDELRRYPHHFRPPHPSDTADRPTGARADRPAGPRAPRPWWAQIAGQWPLALTLLGVAAGIGWAGIGHWKRGTFLIGSAFVVATLLRAFLPERLVGLLGVRSRTIDVACLGVLGVGIVVLALVVAPAP